MISIISTGSIKRTGLAFFPKFLIFNHVFLNVLVSIKRTGFDQAKYRPGGRCTILGVLMTFCSVLRTNLEILGML